jgi:hypothetical protein
MPSFRTATLWSAFLSQSRLPTLSRRLEIDIRLEMRSTTPAKQLEQSSAVRDAVDQARLTS